MTSASESGDSWICPTCARRVPRAVQTCRCGFQASPVAVVEAADLPAPTIRGGSITVTGDDLESAIADGLLTAEQAARLWDRFAARAEARPKFDAAHVAYYAGAVIVLSALGWFLTEAWMNLGGGGIAVIAALYAGAFWLGGETLWKKGLTTPGGLLFTLAVWMVPLAIYGLELATNIWPQDNPGSYHDYYVWVKGSWTLMEVGTIAAGGLAIWVRPFPFLTFPIAFALWFMSMDLTPLVFGKTEYTWDERKWVSVMFGLAILLASYLADLRNRVRQDFAFWGYLFGLLAFWGGLSMMEGGSEASRFVYFLINAALVAISVLIRQRSFIVFGSLGVLGYLGHLSYSVFKDSILFPVVLTMAGIGLIYLGVLYQRHSRAIAVALQSGLPQGIRDLIPPRARYD
jgi:hypothetical protein